ncbi:hypothetical protein H2514_00910 [Lysobacter sp. CW239]|nr:MULTISPECIES: hypothetical protein [Lysobacter]QOD91280.1 hypothetical protein H2514_00910 [Lysobacter sp. CW239]
MKYKGMFVGGIAMAIAMAFAGNAAAAPSDGAQLSNGKIKFFLADPELGLAGVYNANGVDLYFEARRSVDEVSGAPGALSLRVVDGEARTVALGGESYATNWVPQQGEFTAREGFSYARSLTGLGKALEAADLHVSLSAEKSGLADLARQASTTSAGSYPARATERMRASFTPDVMQVVDFYRQSARDIQMTRTRDGMLEAKLGNGIAFVSSQQFVVDEPDPVTGEMGRIDAYSMVKAVDGYVLASELGGDLVPEGWADEMELETARDPDAIAADFGRAATALNALAYNSGSTSGVTLGNPAELAAMHRLAQTMVTHLLPVRDTTPQPLLGGPDNQIAAGGRYQTYIQVWSKPFVLIAQHSGTRVGHWLYNSTTSSVKTHAGWRSFCNHGTCATVSPMTHRCTYTGPRLTYYRRPTIRTDAGGHTCSTQYNVFSTAGGHNCHDDSSVQVRAVRGQSYSTTGGRCGNDGYFSGYAPSCGVQ